MADEQTNLIAYLRVSSEAQDTQLQRDALGGAGATKFFQDKLSSRRAERPGLAAALDYLRFNGRVGYWNYLNASLIALDGRAVSRVQLRSLLMRGRHSSRRGV